MCMDILPTCVSLGRVHAVPSNVRRECQIPGPGIMDVGSLYVGIGLSHSPLEEQSGLLTSELLLQPLKIIFKPKTRIHRQVNI